MKKLFLYGFFLIFLVSCEPNDYFSDLAPAKNCDCQECYLTFPPLTPFSPLYINPMIEIKDESGNLIGHRYDFNPWEESVIKITCCKKVQIDIAYWEVCSATGQILARLIECRTFLSPQSCNDYLSDITYDCVIHDCIVYPFQQ